MNGKIGLGVFLIILLSLSAYMAVSLDIERYVPEPQNILQIIFRYDDNISIESLEVTKGYYWPPPAGYEVREGDNFIIYRKFGDRYVPVGSFYLIPWVLIEDFNEIKKSFNSKGEQIRYPVYSSAINTPVRKELIVPVGEYCILDVISRKFILSFNSKGEKDTSNCPTSEEIENPNNENSDNGELLISGGEEIPVEIPNNYENNNIIDPNNDPNKNLF